MFVKKEIPIRKPQVYAAKEVFEKVVKRGEKVEGGFLIIYMLEGPFFLQEYSLNVFKHRCK